MVTDLRLPTRSPDLPLDITRSHNTLLAKNGDSGTAWIFSLMPHMSERTSDGHVQVIYTDGTVAGFNRQQDGSYLCDNPRVTDTLVKNPDATFTLISKHGIRETWNDSGLTDRVGGFTWRLYKIRKRKDRNHNEINWSYSQDGRLQRVTDPAGRQLTVTTLPGNVSVITSITDWTGRTLTYSWTGTPPNLTSYTDPTGRTWSYGYDAPYRILVSVTTPDGHQELGVTYDDQKRVIRETREGGDEWRYTYNASSTSIEFLKNGVSQGAWTHNWSASNNNITSETDPLGNTHQYGYNAAHQRTTYTDPRGNTQSWTYDAKNNLLSYTNGLGHTWSYQYECSCASVKGAPDWPVGNFRGMQ
jgi:YD repeat-containing protein